MVDFTKRMEEMMGDLDSSASAEAASKDVQEAAALLEELQEIVESIDFARDLRTIGGLPVLKKLLGCPSGELRWRAADVVAACAQNHQDVQVSTWLADMRALCGCFNFECWSSSMQSFPFAT
jgi:hypothetical protein